MRGVESVLASEQHDDGDDDMEAEEVEAWSGNRKRKLWKVACVRAALNVRLPFDFIFYLSSRVLFQANLPDHERALYAALAPSPLTSVVLKSSCRTWEDHLWAQIGIMCEEKESMEMQRLGGAFWEGGLSAVEKGVRDISEAEAESEEAEWEKEVIGTLETLKTVAVADGYVSLYFCAFTPAHLDAQAVGRPRLPFLPTTHYLGPYECTARCLRDWSPGWLIFAFDV